MDKGLTPDTMNTFTGLSNGVAEGLATGPIPDSIAKPLLQQGDNPKRKVFGSSLDYKPLWEYIDPSLSVSASPGDDIPASCEAQTFDPTVGTNIPKDWDGDGVKDEPNSWEHLSACLTEYVAGGHTAPLFVDTLEDSPRFGYVPLFWESSFGSGNSWLHIKKFKAAWIQGTWWKKGNKVKAFHPGEPGSFTGGGKWSLIQLSGLVLPDATLPSGLRGKPPLGGGVNPFQPELYR
jgi:hypothetical protein